MAASRLIILSVAVAAAGGAGYIAKKMSGPPQEVAATVQPSIPALATTKVLVLSGDVPMGATVDGLLRWQDWPADAVGANFITRDVEADALEKLKGSIARSAMYSGEPLRRSKLIGEGQSFMSSILPSGKRAIATQIAADTSAGGFILPNDFVDVIMTRRAQGAAAEEMVSLPKRSSRTFAFWPSIRQFRKTRKAARSRWARPQRSSLPRNRPRSLR